MLQSAAFGPDSGSLVDCLLTDDSSAGFGDDTVRAERGPCRGDCIMLGQWSDDTSIGRSNHDGQRKMRLVPSDHRTLLPFWHCAAMAEMLGLFPDVMHTIFGLSGSSFIREQGIVPPFMTIWRLVDSVVLDTSSKNAFVAFIM